MRHINKVILIGNVGKDPEIQVFESGRKKAAFSFATTERYRDKAGVDQSVTEWHNIVVWGPQADTVEKYVRKGNPLYLEGRIKYREYEDKDGVKKRITEIMLDTFSMLSSKPAVDSGTEIQAPETSTPPPPDTSLNKIDDDLPF
jgi:single-strand DNA-binding protein